MLVRLTDGKRWNLGLMLWAGAYCDKYHTLKVAFLGGRKLHEEVFEGVNAVTVDAALRAMESNETRWELPEQPPTERLQGAIEVGYLIDPPLADMASDLDDEFLDDGRSA